MPRCRVHRRWKGLSRGSHSQRAALQVRSPLPDNVSSRRARTRDSATGPANPLPADAGLAAREGVVRDASPQPRGRRAAHRLQTIAAAGPSAWKQWYSCVTDLPGRALGSRSPCRRVRPAPLQVAKLWPGELLDPQTLTGPYCMSRVRMGWLMTVLLATAPGPAVARVACVWALRSTMRQPASSRRASRLGWLVDDDSLPCSV
jgi:hypothetical protein